MQKYKIAKFYQFTGPAAFCESPQNRISAENLGKYFDWPNFTKKCVCADINKTVLADIASVSTDYLLLDLCELRFRNCRIYLQNGDSFLATQTGWLEKLLANKDFCGFFGVKTLETDIKLSEEEVYDCLNVFANFIKSHYSQERVILVKNFPVWRHLNDEKRCFEEYWIAGITETRIRLEKFYRYFQMLLPDMHIIEMPVPCLGDALHTWGMDPLHFTDEYYQYLYKAIEAVTEKRSDEKEKLQELREIYSQYFCNLEKLKRFEYYVAKQLLPENILQNGDFNVNDRGAISGWRLSCSKTSRYRVEEKTLACGNEEKGWAILSQNIASKKVLGKTLTFSVEFKTEGENILNLALRYYDESEKQVYLFHRQAASYGAKTIYTVSVEIPANFHGAEELVFSLYTNKPLHEAVIYRVKAEENKGSTLFDF